MWPSLLVSTALAAVYLIWEPPSADLAAQTFRADLFADQGFEIWSTAWYGGFYLPGYSVVFPPLAAWLGVRVVGAIAAVAAAGLFAALARRRFGARASLGAVWFAAGVGAWLFTGRIAFLLGIAIGLGALLAADSRRLTLAGVLAAMTALASPVAGLFVAIAGLAVGLAGDRPRGVALTLPPSAAIACLALAFPTGGEEPFVLSAFVAIPLLAIGTLLFVPAEQRTLRIGVIVYAALALAVFAIPNPLGGNLARLGALFAGPVAMLVVWRRPVVLAALALPLLYWQLNAPVRDTIVGVGDPSTESAFYEPLLERLDAEAVASDSSSAPRIHIPPTQNRWEAVHVAERFDLARGWLRQLESDDFELFADDHLTPASYRSWLRQHGVGRVAVPEGVERDYLAEDEVELIERGLPYLALEWENEDWRLYRVDGEAAPRFRWTPYWELVAGDGCVEREGDWTRVEASAGDELELVPRFSVDALLGRERVCSE